MTESERGSVLQSQTRYASNWLHAYPQRLQRHFRGVLALLLTSATVLPLQSALAQKKGDHVQVLAGSALRTVPGGRVVGVLSRALDGPVEMVQGSAVRLRLRGFLSEKSVKLEANGTRAVVAGAAENHGILRTGPSEKDPALATLQLGAVVFPGPRSASFLPVNRTVWVDKSRLAKLTAPAASGALKPTRPEARVSAAQTSAAEPVAQAPRPTAAAAAVPASLVPALPPKQTIGLSALRLSPDGDPITSLPPGTVVSPLTTDNGWTRVRLEGWIQTKSLAAASAKAAGELSAADLRADPKGTKGRAVRWTVETLSYQLGDGLRRELNGEPYLLARGPGNERAILYLAVPDSLISAARALAPLTSVTITARVRTGRSEPGGVPILDLLELVRR